MRADQWRSSSDAAAVSRAAPMTTAPSTTSRPLFPSGIAVSMIERNSSGGTSARPAPIAIMTTKPIS